MSSRLLEFKPVPMVVSLRGVKAAARRLRGGLRASLDPSTLKDAAHGVSPNRRKFRDLWTGALSSIGNNRTKNPGKASRRNGTGNRLKEPTPSPVLRPPGVPALLRIGRMTDTSPPNGNCKI
jgi:hypothetical protein